jgi:phosphatidate cytidylyltransferase
MNSNSENGDTAEFNPPPIKPKQLQKRIATAILMAAAAIFTLWMGGAVLVMVVLLCAIQLHRELEDMLKNSETPIIQKYLPILRIAGLFYIAIPSLSLLALRNAEYAASENAGFHICMYVVLMVVATDTAAFFVGKLYGKRPLASKISPNKSIEGLLGGMAGAAIVAVLYLPYTPWPSNALFALMLGAIVAVISQAGDLLESYLKRLSNTKDSGNLLPGHGGLFDRLDGYMLTLPLFVWLVLSNAEMVTS